MHYHIYCLDNKARINSIGQYLFNGTKIQEEAEEVWAEFSGAEMFFWDADKKLRFFQIC